MDLSYILNSPDVERVATALETIARNSSKSVLTDRMKAALLNMFQYVAYTDNQGQSHFDELYDALYGTLSYPCIIATYEPGSHVAYTDDTLSSLIPYLTVKYYTDESDNGTIVPSSNYTLSGDLASGTGEVNVSYLSYTTQFFVRTAQSPIVGLNKVGTGVYGSSNYFVLNTPRDNRAVIVTTSNNERLKTKTASETQPSGTSDYSPIRIPKGANNVVYSFGTDGWSSASILLFDAALNLYIQEQSLSGGTFVGGTDIIKDVSSYNDGEHYIVPFANNAEQDASKCRCTFTY